MEDLSFWAILVMGFLLGIKHAIEPDHVIAVSTIASRSRSLWRSTLAGVFWGIGHTLTLFVMGSLLLVFKREMPDVVAMSLEFMVGLMLVYLGVTSLIRLYQAKLHAGEHLHEEGVTHRHYQSSKQDDVHQHVSPNAFYGKSMVIGFVHGLAGSAAMFVLTMSTVSSAWQAGVYILTFGVGTVLGMLLFTTLIGIPFAISDGRPFAERWLTRATGVVSTAFGCYYIYNLGVTEGLFRMWIG